MRPLSRTALSRTGLATALATGLLGVALGLPGTGAAAALPAVADHAITLTDATALVDALSQELERSAAQDGALRVALERLAEQHDLAQARLDRRVRQVWMARRPDPLGGLADRLATAGLRRIAGPDRVAGQGAAAAVQVERRLVDAVADRSVAATALQAQGQAVRARLAVQAGAALQAQEAARTLLALAERQLARQALAGQQVAAQQARLAASRTALDRASATVTTALTPAQTLRGRRAQADQAPLVALVEAAGAGYPAGYVPTGEILFGLASWYGPGFVGSPTATGAPYDPERLTCAHPTLRLGTVLRVSAYGRAVNCLVNDRGPYVGERILDLSRAGARALGFDGVAPVTIEVLTPTAASATQSTSR